MTSHKLVISEKPSVAMTIGKVLNARKRQDGYIEGNGYIISWCIGHLVAPAPPDEYDDKYRRWDMLNLPIIPEEWQYDVLKGTSKQFNTIKKLMKRKDVTEVICATDAGREGEYIFRLVYNTAECRKPFKRLWISSLEEQSIREGFNSLHEGREFDNMYHAASARSKADWLIGMNMTRLYSLKNNMTLNIGRVQTPVLNMLVERERNIIDFKPESYYSVELDCGSFKAVSDKIQDKAEAEHTALKCSDTTAEVTETVTESKSTASPKLYDLTSLQRDVWQRSNRINEECARYIQENASAAHNDHRMTEFSNALVEKYGLERAMLVVARNIKSRPGDGRFNRDVVERAAAIEIPDMQLEYDNTRSYICTTHSVILNFVFRDLMDIEKALNRMPDKTTPEQMHDYGYTSDIMMPMDTEAAREYFDKGLTVYALYGDNSESMITSYDEIDAHDGLFGVEADEWKAYLDSEHHAPMAEEKASNKEAAFIFGQEDGFAIYQLRDDVSRDYHFEDLDRIGGAAMVDKSNYQFVYADDIEIGQAENTFDVLENIYEEFNQFKPEDFKGHSLSVSDMVVLKQDGELAAYYVDRFGFESIPHFYGDNPKDLVWDNDKQTYLAKATERTSIENNITPAEENKNDMQILSEREADELAANPMADNPVGRMEDMVSSGNATSYRAQIERAKQAAKAEQAQQGHQTSERKSPEQRASLIKRINDNKAKIAGKAAQDKSKTKNKGLEV